MISCIGDPLKNSPHEPNERGDSIGCKGLEFRVPQRTINLVLITLAQM